MLLILLSENITHFFILKVAQIHFRKYGKLREKVKKEISVTHKFTK